MAPSSAPKPNAVRWKQWRFYFTDMHATGNGMQRLTGMYSSNAPMAGYPATYNIELDPHENLNVSVISGWTIEAPFEAIKEYYATLEQRPNPPAPDITEFRNPTG